MGSWRMAACLFVLGSIAGCHHHAGSRVVSAPATAASGGANARWAPAPIGRPLAGSTVALARIDGRRIALVADSDGSAIRRVDLDARAEIEPLPVEAGPTSLLVLDDGRIVATTANGTLTTIAGFEGIDRPGTDRAWIHVPTEPVDLALSPDRSTIYVTSGFGHALVGLRAADLERTLAIDLPREPRALTVSDDGTRVFIAHAVGSHLSVVDVRDKKATATRVSLRAQDLRSPSRDDEADDMSAKAKLARRAAREKRAKDGLPTCQGFALAKSASVPGRIFAPEVMVDPGEPTVKSSGYGASDGEASEEPTVAVVDTATTTPIAASMTRLDAAVRGEREAPCLLPRAATIDGPTRTLLVACRGIDSLVAYDAMAASPAKAELRRWPVGAGPNGVAVDSDARQAVVWSQFDRTLSIVSLDGTAPTSRIATGPSAAPSSIALGRMIFHRTGDSRISGDGRACASCHPDGKDDGLVWSTPEGPRRSIMLAGRLSDTGPFSWQGNAPTVQKHLQSTFSRLQGQGLEGADLEALVGYLQSLSGRETNRSDDEPDSVHAGAKIFGSSRAGCSGCHSGPAFTDGGMHNVGSGRAFNTPSLLNVGSGGPWFHDGRYTTLRDLLRKSDGKMGHTKQLSDVQIAQLEDFLRSL